MRLPDKLPYNTGMFAVIQPLHARIADAYHYKIPPELAETIRPGVLVTVPFGKQRVQGVVLALSNTAPVEQLLPIEAVLDQQPVLWPHQIAFLQNLAKISLTPAGELLPLFLPAGLAQQPDWLYRATNAPLPHKLTTTQRRLLDLLASRGPLRARQINRHIPSRYWKPAAEGLIRQGLIVRQPVLPEPRIRPKTVRTVQLAVPPETARASYATLSTRENVRQRRQAALEFLLHEPAPVEVNWVYAASGCNLQDLYALAERDLVILRETRIWRDPLAKTTPSLPTAPPELTPAQKAALEALAQAPHKRLALLEGVTASGKTELYLRLTAETLARGQNAIILIPEIALTPQIVRRFMHRFPGEVGLLHSQLSDGERYDTWHRARNGQLRVIIGPRSALFAPLPQIGLIVLDECHDAAYHPSQPPFYDARTAAEAYAALLDARLVLGSATPNVTQRYQAINGRWLHLRLPERVTGQAGLPEVHIVDMRKELAQGNTGIFSRRLQEALSETLLAGQQAILFLNRRGSATYVFCRDCGYTLACPHCQTPLTWHEDQSELRCHRCNYRRRMPSRCPECGSSHIRQYGLGTERVESEIRRLFPKARVLRLDRDAVPNDETLDLIWQHFHNRQADILIGTQMVAKGMDFPHVGLVGVVLADVGLHLPDPFAAERVFQLLVQVTGRAGRSAAGGQAVIQTYHPDHYALQAAASQDVDGFYQQELDYRRRLGYPPFSRMVRLEFRSHDPDEAERRAAALAATLDAWIQADPSAVNGRIGPAPAFFSPVNGIHRWQIVLHGSDPGRLLRGRIPNGWLVDADPVSLL